MSLRIRLQVLKGEGNIRGGVFVCLYHRDKIPELIFKVKCLFGLMVLVCGHLASPLLAVMVKQNIMLMSTWWNKVPEPMYTGSREDKGAPCKVLHPSAHTPF